MALKDFLHALNRNPALDHIRFFLARDLNRNLALNRIFRVFRKLTD